MKPRTQDAGCAMREVGCRAMAGLRRAFGRSKPRSGGLRWLLVFSLLSSSLLSSAAAPDKVVTVTPAPAAIPAEHADDAPLAFPPLEHYAKLWTDSMFTTKALPPPDDAPKGPIFTDSLTLVGMYEVDGAVVGVLLDKTTSGVMEVRIGAENESGIKIVKVNPGATPEKTRLQLAKGQEAGWVTFASDAAPPAEQAVQGGPGGPGAPGAMPGQPGNAIPGMTQGPAIPGRPAMAPQPNRAMTAPRTLLPPANQMPQAPAMQPPAAQPPPAQAAPPPVLPAPAAAANAPGDDLPPLPQ